MKMVEMIQTQVGNMSIAHEGNENEGILSVSMGLLTMRDKIIDKDLLYKEVDKLLYQAKRSGRNKIKRKII